ncbi:hypothetical protein DVS28_a3179 [Euzebya pacifica]|uniref:Methyltransferase type 11 domain-containing protein n=1 Tax=Euzebya pacifica TaxID=1608957 RepID=A0A346Y058_9ACTN|nr:methyltransferase domain-containing protein [Euzebya pacifica]AXV07855.1 hypothetical protein DVS28_a3179 [Euzebya pacifica]
MTDTLDPTDPVPESVMPVSAAAALRAAYAVPPRAYHSLDHAARVARIATDLGADRACLLAAWAHDVVYRPGEPDNEDASAAWLVDRLPDDPDVAEAARLIRLTATHDVDPGDTMAAVLCDADLSILGGDPAGYEAYRRAVREEYAAVPDEAWRTGRAAVLRRLLDRPRLFLTDTAHDRWEQRARTNLADELADLLGSAPEQRAGVTPTGDGGLVTDNPHAAVFDRAAATYDRVGVDFFSTFGRLLVDHAGVALGERVLDIGTGRGAVLFPAAAAVGPEGHVLGLDLAPGMVERTSAEVAERGLDHVRVVLGDAADPPLADEGFDAVLSSLVLFFLHDPAAGVRRWARLVSPGGRLGLCTFLPDGDDERFRELVEAFVEVPDHIEPQPQPDGPTSFELVKDVAWLDDAIAAAGLVDIDAVEVRHATGFEDVEQWWRWAWSQGMRSALELIPEARHAAFKEAVAADLAANALPDGRLGFHVTVRLTTARRPD